MRKNILWTGLTYHSTENCIVNIASTGAIIQSTITGTHEGIIYKVDYAIKTNSRWETVYLNITSQLSGIITTLAFEGDGKGNWTKNGKPAPEFTNCIDVDITLTPFTNTLPINRLKLNVNEPQKINVLYIDVLEQKVTANQQQYTKLSDTRYKFETIPHDFEAVITVDESGLVSYYPELFERTAVQESK